MLPLRTPDDRTLGGGGVVHGYCSVATTEGSRSYPVTKVEATAPHTILLQKEDAST